MSAIRINKRRAHGVFGCGFDTAPGRGGSGQRLSGAFVERLMIARWAGRRRHREARAHRCARAGASRGGAAVARRSRSLRWRARRARREVVSAAPHLKEWRLVRIEARAPLPPPLSSARVSCDFSGQGGGGCCCCRRRLLLVLLSIGGPRDGAPPSSSSRASTEQSWWRRPKLPMVAVLQWAPT